MPFCYWRNLLALFLHRNSKQETRSPDSVHLSWNCLVVFYSLLISLSEHINFDLAYLIGSLAVVLQISLYSLSILKQKKLSAIIGSVLGLLYFYIYILLQLQGYALLMGSVGLFILVAFTMYLSRNVNWHELGQKKGEGKPMEEGLDV